MTDLNIEFYEHLKTGNEYAVIGEVINATNENDGQEMVLYMDSNGNRYVRESSEFYEKFELKKNVDVKEDSFEEELNKTLESDNEVSDKE